jgi:DNA-binding NarL/FixJ family response regulator
MSDPQRAAPRVLLLCGDLFFSTQLRSAAQAQGVSIDVELQAPRAVERAASRGYQLIVVDLEFPNLDLAALLGELPAENRPQVLAFGPHVQTARLRAARDAGCDHVVPRSIAVETVAKLVGNA